MDTSVMKQRLAAPVCLAQALFNFSFYGVRSIFVLYAIQKFSLTTSQTVSLFGTFMALCYGTSLVGGHIADRGLGVKNTIVAGGAFSALGLLLILFPSQDVRCLGLALASLGSGFFKPNIPTAAGLLFEDPQDPKKDKVFSLLYIAMNAGGLPASLVCGFVGQTWGWDYGMILVASVFASSACFVYKAMRFHPAYRENLTWSRRKLLASLVSLIFLLYLVFQYQAYFHSLMGVITCASVACFGKILYACQPGECKDVGAIALYILLSALFGALYEQAGTSLMLFYDKAVDRHILGTVIPPSAFLTLDPLFVLLFGPVLLFLTAKYLEKKKPLDGFTKMGWGFLCIAASFGIMAAACRDTSSLVSPLWVAGAMFVQTLGEFWIVPVSFSHVSRHAPDRFKSILMGFWSMSIAYGHYLAGFIATFSLGDASGVPSLSGDNILERYQPFFVHLALLALYIGVLLLLGQGVKGCIRRYREKMRPCLELVEGEGSPQGRKIYSQGSLCRKTKAARYTRKT